MTYDWRPTASRNATTTGELAVVTPPPAVTMAAAIEDFIEAAEQGRAVNRSGRRYRPSALRDLTGILRFHVAPALGERPLPDVGRADVQAFVDRLGAERLSESRIRSVISALRALYAYAIDRRYVEFNPADGLTMPSGGGDDPGEAEAEANPPRPERDPGDYEPMAVLPDRLLSLALRAALVVFAVVAVISLLQPA
jgi:Phage integrase, N-terminal SAM-like domain